MYFLYKNEYRILNLLNHHKKGTKGERRKIEEMNLSILVIIYIEMYIILYVYIYMEMSQGNSLYNDLKQKNLVACASLS
jgi:hypothetical protein